MPNDQPARSSSKSDQSQRSLTEAMDRAHRVIESARAEVARSRALSQSETDPACEIDRISGESDAVRLQKGGP
jgi:DNA-binding GntR family transcriptional regulator